MATDLKNTKEIAQYPYDALAVGLEEGSLSSEGALLDTINCAEAQTLDEMFRERVRRSPEKIAYTQYDQAEQSWVNYSWSEMATQVERWQVAFREGGLKKGDRVAVCYPNSVDWIVFDQAALRLGLVVVPLYTADRADNIAYVIANAGARLALFANAALWTEVQASDEDVSCVETALVFTGNSDDADVVLVEQWLPEHGQHFERGVTDPDDLASIVYTSGTTGRPKGVMLSHRNMLSNAYNGMRSMALTTEDSLLSFLPLSHTFERTVGYYAAMMSGSQVTFNRSIPELANDLLDIKPTVIISVPRIFERIHNKMSAALAEMSPIKRFLFGMAMKVGWHKFCVQQGSKSWHPRLLLAGVFNMTVAKQARARFGGRLNYAIVGGAPLSFEVAKTFTSLGIPLLQGYGLTEFSPVISVNTLRQNRPDSIGLLLRGGTAKLMEKNELWVKGDSVMLGYWRNDEATDQVIVEDDSGRWLRTGDCASVDEQGYLRIVGRLKEILVLANGEKIPPADIEAAIARNPLFSNVMVVGEGLSYLSALVVLNKRMLSKVCKQHNWPENDVPSEALNAYLLSLIPEQMSDFPGYARIRRVHVCDSDWTVEDGLLTPTLKLKRAKIMARYADGIDAMYAGRGVHKL